MYRVPEFYARRKRLGGQTPYLMDVSAALVAPIPGLGARRALLPPTGSRRRAPRPPPEAGSRLRPGLAVLRDTWPYLPGKKKPRVYLTDGQN